MKHKLMAIAGLVALMSLVWANSALAIPTITEFSAGLGVGASPTGIAAGPDGNLWFTEGNRRTIGNITPAGVITEFPEATRASPFEITAGPDGNMWFAENAGNGIGMITPAGVLTEFSEGITAREYPLGIAAGPDGNLWFTETGHDAIGRITTSGTVSDFSEGVTTGAYPYDITAGPDGNLWFTEANGDGIGRITPSGVVTEFPIASNAAPRGITAGPDGNVWFAELGASTIGRITPAGVVTEFSEGITPGSGPTGITAGPDGNLWFTESEGNAIGRITPAGVVTEYSTGITPGSGPTDIAAGADGNLWFTEHEGNAIGRVTLSPTDPASPPSIESVVSNNPPAAAPAPPSYVPPSVPVASQPVLGRSVRITRLSGAVLAKTSSTGQFVPITGSVTLEVGSEIDVTHGALRIETAGTHSTTQAASVWGGVFSIYQHRGGLTSLIVQASPSPRAHRSNNPTLWIKGDDGHFRTHTGNSLTTGRETEWATIEMPSGTLTRVLAGSVRVYDRHRHHTVALSGGHSYMARR